MTSSMWTTRTSEPWPISQRSTWLLLSPGLSSNNSNSQGKHSLRLALHLRVLRGLMLTPEVLWT